MVWPFQGRKRLMLVSQMTTGKCRWHQPTCNSTQRYGERLAAKADAQQALPPLGGSRELLSQAHYPRHRVKGIQRAACDRYALQVAPNAPVSAILGFFCASLISIKHARLLTLKPALLLPAKSYLQCPRAALTM